MIPNHPSLRPILEERALKIKVRYFTTLRELAGTKEEDLEMKEEISLAQVIDEISLMYGEEAFDYLHVRATGMVDPSIKFLVNGVDAHRLRGFETRLREGDVVSVIPPIGGG